MNNTNEKNQQNKLNKQTNYISDVKNEKAAIVALVILTLILVYFSLFFIHNIVDIGTISSSQTVNLSGNNISNNTGNNTANNAVNNATNNTANNIANNAENNTANRTGINREWQGYPFNTNILTSNKTYNGIKNTINKMLNKLYEVKNRQKPGDISDGNNVPGNNTATNNTPGNITPEDYSITINNTIGNNTTIVDNEARFRVLENGTDWNELKQLSIFSNAYFPDSMIAPGVQGTYNFTVENQRSTALRYNITFSEVNPYNVNMKFKLKRNGSYIVGDENTYVYVSELSKEGFEISAKGTDVYTIEWKWVDSENDTEVGMTDGANYKMCVQLYAEEI